MSVSRRRFLGYGSAGGAAVLLGTGACDASTTYAAQDSGVRNLVVITGDRHQNYALELKRDFANPDSATATATALATRPGRRPRAARHRSRTMPGR